MGDDVTAQKLSRVELYDRVWTIPMRTLAAEFGISDVGLSKLCHRHHIPTPPRGYWVQREHGKATPPPPLLQSTNGSEAIVIESTPPRAISPAVEATPVVEVSVKQRLLRPHPLVERTKSALRIAKPKEDGRVTANAPNALSITIGPRSVDRAIRILDALFKAIEARGHRIVLQGSTFHRKLVAMVAGEEIGIGFGEKVTQEAREITAAERERAQREWWFRPSPYRQIPSGRLFLRMDQFWGFGLRTQWIDGKKQRIETHLGGFVVQLEMLAERIKEHRKELQKTEEERRAREIERIEQMRLLRKEEERFKALQAEADAWHRSQRLRQYIAAVRADALTKRGSIREGSELDCWLQWASEQADRIDPLAES